MSSIIMRSLSRPLVGFFLTFSFSVFVVAEVDIKSGTFSITRSDQSLDTELVGFDASRTYNSTVSYNGLFGKGWCSGFETRLTVIAEGQLVVTECGAGSLKFYSSSDFKESHVAQAVDQIIQKAQRAGEKIRPDYREEIISNPALRERLVSKYKIKFKTSKTPYTMTPFPNSEQVIFQKNQYVLKTAAGLSRAFDSEGRLAEHRHKQGDTLRLIYDSKGLKTVSTGRGQNISFKLDTNGHVTEMRGPAEITRFYYSDQGYLTKVSQKQGTEKYTYEDSLLASVESHTEKIKVKYNPATRFVSAVEKNACVTSYAYDIKKQENKFDVAVTFRCAAKEISKIKYSFQYQKGADGALFQKRMVATDGKGGLTLAEYIAEGKPSKIVRRGEVFEFGYDGQGRLVSKETSEQKVKYEYGARGSLVGINLYPKNQKGAETHRFNYDEAARLSSVVIKDETIRYGYDRKGRLVSIKSKVGPDFSITNDGLTGRILEIKAHKYGAFKLQYSANGQIKKTEWQGDIKKALAILDRYELLRRPYEQSLEFGVE